MTNDRFYSAGPLAAAAVLAAAAGCGAPHFDAREAVEEAGGGVRWERAEVREIRLTRVERASEVLAALPRLDTVESLEAAETDLNDDALRRLPAWPLRRLDLRGTRITNRSLARIADWRELRWLSLSDTAVDRLQPLAALTRLETLALPPAADDEDLAAVARLPRLRTLYAADTQLAGPGLAALDAASLPRLRTLHLDRTPVDDAAIARLPRHPALERVTLAGTSAGDGAAAHLAAFPRLDYLDFSDTQLTDAGLLRLAELELLYVVDVPGARVTRAGVEEMRRRRPDVRIAHSLPPRAEQPQAEQVDSALSEQAVRGD